jgi:hypothetical protein
MRGSKSKDNLHLSSVRVKSVRRLLVKVTLLVAIMVSTAGWIWLLGAGIRWLIVKL